MTPDSPAPGPGTDAPPDADPPEPDEQGVGSPDRRRFLRHLPGRAVEAAGRVAGLGSAGVAAGRAAVDVLGAAAADLTAGAESKAAVAAGGPTGSADGRSAAIADAVAAPAAPRPVDPRSPRPVPPPAELDEFARAWLDARRSLVLAANRPDAAPILGRHAITGRVGSELVVRLSADGAKARAIGRDPAVTVYLDDAAGAALVAFGHAVVTPRLEEPTVVDVTIRLERLLWQDADVTDAADAADATSEAPSIRLTAEQAAHLERARHAVVATIRRSGAPQLTPVWFRWTGEAFHVSTPNWTAKTRNLRRDPRIVLCIDDPTTGDYATVEGRAVLLEGAAVREPTIALIARYRTDPAEALAHWARIAEPGDRVLIVVRPDRILWRRR